MSGAVGDRPALRDALEYARSGDTIIVWKLDRLARSMKQLIETIEGLRVRGIGFRSLTEALDTTTPQGVLVFHLFSALAEFERALIRPSGPAALKRCIQSRSVCRSMPPIFAASAPILAIADRCKRQQAPALIDVLRTPGQCPKLSRRKILPQFHRCWHGVDPWRESPSRLMSQKNRLNGIPHESHDRAFGINSIVRAAPFIV